MKGIYTTTANAGSLDECPMVYKTPESIINAIGDAVIIEKRLRPIYNYKSINLLRLSHLSPPQNTLQTQCLWGVIF